MEDMQLDNSGEVSLDTTLSYDTPACSYCGQPITEPVVCACGKVMYCSSDHLAQDWPFHEEAHTEPPK